MEALLSPSPAVTPPPPSAQPRVAAAVADSILSLPARYLPDRGPVRRRRYRLAVTGCPAFTVHVEGGTCLVLPDDGAPVHAELRTDPASWLDLASGDRTGLDLFFLGLLEVRGDLNEALRLDTLFAPPPGSPGELGHARVSRLRVGRVGIEVFTAGPPAAPPVLFLHGLGASKVSLLPTIAGLAEGRRVIAIDLPGFGKSDAPVAARYDAEWIAGLAEQVLDALGVARAAVVGNSMGGRVALEMALRSPDRVAALGLLCPAVAFDEYRFLRPLLSALRVDMAVGATRWVMPRRLVDAGMRSLFADPRRVPAANLTAAVEDFLRSMTDRRRRMAFLACARRLGLDNPRRFWRRLGSLSVPSLWVFGDSDRLVSCAYADMVRRHVADATVEVWSSCGHVPQFEYPHRTIDRLESFFASAADAGVADRDAPLSRAARAGRRDR